MTWLHVTASPEHASKAEAAGVDAVVAVGTEAGGHPLPSEVGTLVVVRAVVKAVRIPVIAGGGLADGAGIAAMFCLGAEAVQLGTRFLLTPESNLHQAYKQRALAAGMRTPRSWGAASCRSASSRTSSRARSRRPSGQACRRKISRR